MDSFGTDQYHRVTLEEKRLRCSKCKTLWHNPGHAVQILLSKFYNIHYKVAA